MFFKVTVRIFLLNILVDDGYCQSNRCFRKYPNCILVSSQPFDRQSAMSVQQCQDHCLRFVRPPMECKSFNYNVAESVCDLYPHTGKQSPARLIQFPNRDYYEPTGLCTGGVPATTVRPTPATTPRPTAQPTCPQGQTERYTALDGVELQGNNDFVFPGVSEAQCLQYCTDNVGPTGQTYNCRSFDFISTNRDCVISQSTGTGPQLVPNANSIYLEKFCTPANNVANCPPVIRRRPQEILVGFSNQVITTATVEECINACMQTTQINCLAGTYFPQVPNENCILSIGDSNTNPELIDTIPASEEITEYFELNCNRRASARRVVAPPRKVAPAASRPSPQIAARPSPVAARPSPPAVQPPRQPKPVCQRGTCCPYQGSCSIGFRVTPRGDTEWCKNPCNL